MKKAVFLELPLHDQELIVLAEFPDYETRAYEDTCFGIFYEVSDEEIEERVKYAEDYDTFDTLESMLPEFSEARIQEIVAGSPLSDTEKLALKVDIADQDIENWTGLHGWKKTCEDGDVFIVFWGFPQVQGGIHLEYCRAFADKKQACEWFENYEIHSYM